MEETVFLEKIDGLMAEQVIRDHEYSMYSRHFHESYELYILLAGERYYFIDRETYLVKSGMAVMVSRNQIHKTSMAGDSYHDRLLLQMDGAAFSPYMKMVGISSMEELFERLHGVVEYSREDWAVVLWLLSQLKQELKERKEGYEVVVKMLVVHILVLTARNRIQEEQREPAGQSGALGLFAHDNFQAKTARHQKIREVTDYLLSHYETGESQEQLAKRFYVSKSYMCRIFKEVTGFTLNEYQNLVRIKAAQKLLIETKLPVTEIAAQVGFESITYFERVFKKHTDERPLQYRKKHTKKSLGD